MQRDIVRTAFLLFAFVGLAGCSSMQGFRGTLQGPAMPTYDASDIQKVIFATCTSEEPLPDGRRLIVLHSDYGDNPHPKFPTLVMAVRGDSTNSLAAGMDSQSAVEAWLIDPAIFHQRYEQVEQGRRESWEVACGRYCAEFVQLSETDRSGVAGATRVVGTVTIHTAHVEYLSPFDVEVDLQNESHDAEMKGRFRVWSVPVPNAAAKILGLPLWILFKGTLPC